MVNKTVDLVLKLLSAK